MRRKKRFWLLLAATICFAALVAAFAPSIIGPMIDNYIGRSELNQSLASCKPDELRFQLYYGKHGEEGGTFSFTSRHLSGGDSNSGSYWSWAGETRGPVFSARLGRGKLFTDNDTQYIKSLLSALPPPSASASLASYRDEFHLAYYQGNQLRIYHFPKSAAPPQVTELCKTLGIYNHAQ